MKVTPKKLRPPVKKMSSVTGASNLLNCWQIQPLQLALILGVHFSSLQGQAFSSSQRQRFAAASLQHFFKTFIVVKVHISSISSIFHYKNLPSSIIVKVVLYINNL